MDSSDQLRDSVLSPEECDQLTALYRAEQLKQYLQERRPGCLIEPHTHGQWQALCSDRTYRILIPGNGWGKTTCMALDADLLMQRDDPFKPHVIPKPDRPTTAIWYCQKYQQFEIMRPDIEGIFTHGWTWKDQKHYYIWPNGSRLFVLSSDSDWKAIQGVELDAVYFDEHPDRKFWVEMQYRRRGKKKTRYMVAATMTQGITWFVRQLIQPIEAYAIQQGLTEDQLLTQQPHPKSFLWNCGGIKDNPGADEEDVEHYEGVEGASEAEKEVRTRGGYADFTGTPVFNLDSLNHLSPTEGENGGILFTPDEDETLSEPLLIASDGRAYGHRFAGVKVRKFFEWRPEWPVEGGRITIYEPPDPDQRDNYIIGADFAAGLEGKDYDAAIVGVKTSEGQVRQVAEAHGWWGDVFFAEVLYMLGVLYFEAFIVGERQFGLPAMRRLYDEMGYTYQYYRRAEDQRSRRMSDRLGHHRSAGDTVIPNHRLAVKRGDCILVSKDAIREHKRYQFRSRNKTDTIDDVEVSSDLITGAPSGENDDLVMAAAYMTHGAREVVHYTRPQRPHPRGTFGDVMDVERVLSGQSGKKNKDPYAI